MNFSKIPSFIKLPAYKRFGYTPVYYNEEKEDLMERVRQAQHEKEGKLELQAGSLKQKWASQRRNAKNSYSISYIRVLVVVALLSALFFFVLK